MILRTFDGLLDHGQYCLAGGWVDCVYGMITYGYSVGFMSMHGKCW